MSLNIGVTGYSAKKFDKLLAKTVLSLAIDIVMDIHRNGKEKIVIVSGLTDIGVPAIAYRIAEEMDYDTKGIACKKAHEYPCYSVDQEVIVGDDWGDESETFINSIDVLIRVGGGSQAHKEVEMALLKKIPVYEYDIPEKSS